MNLSQDKIADFFLSDFVGSQLRGGINGLKLLIKEGCVEPDDEKDLNATLGYLTDLVVKVEEEVDRRRAAYNAKYAR